MYIFLLLSFIVLNGIIVNKICFVVGFQSIVVLPVVVWKLQSILKIQSSWTDVYLYESNRNHRDALGLHERRSSITLREQSCSTKDDNEPLLDALYIPDESNEISSFLDFLNEEECEGIDSTCIGISTKTGVRGLYATETFEPGEFILAIPVISAMDVLSTTNETTTDVEKGIAFLQTYGTSANHNHTNRLKWERYLKCLPTIDTNFHSTVDFWNEMDINELQIPTLIQDSMNRKVQINSLATKYNMNPEELQFATWLVRTRMFSTLKEISNPVTTDNYTTLELEQQNPGTRDYNDGKNPINDGDYDDINGSSNENKQQPCLLLRRTVLIPYMDMINHAINKEQSNAVIHVIEGHTDDESMYCVQATQYIPAGTEILITYGTGTETSLELFSKYGFFGLLDSTNGKSIIVDDDIKTTHNILNGIHNENDYNTYNLDILQDISWNTTITEDLKLLRNITSNDSKDESNRINSYIKTAIEVRLYFKVLQASFKANQKNS